MKIGQEPTSPQEVESLDNLSVLDLAQRIEDIRGDFSVRYREEKVDSALENDSQHQEAFTRLRDEEQKYLDAYRAKTGKDYDDDQENRDRLWTAETLERHKRKDVKLGETELGSQLDALKADLEKQEETKFVLEKEKSGKGFIYDFYFVTQEEAEAAVRDFWNAYEGGGSIREGLESGMLDAFKHEITGGDRTSPGKSYSKKYSERPFRVQFNGNTKALSSRGEDALRRIGLIE